LEARLREIDGGLGINMEGDLAAEAARLQVRLRDIGGGLGLTEDEAEDEDEVEDEE
jgi:hypothetical protein